MASAARRRKLEEAWRFVVPPRHFKNKETINIAIPSCIHSTEIFDVRKK